LVVGQIALRITAVDLSRIYPKRQANVHKGQFGTVLVVCGSKLYSGSAALAAVGAVRAGADLAVVTAVERAANIAANTLPDLITYPLRGSQLTSSHVSQILKIARLRKVNSMVIGCGLGNDSSTLAAIRKLIQKITVPSVIDADGLAAISKGDIKLNDRPAVLTPHLGELAKLLNRASINNDMESRLAGAKQAAHQYKAVVLLKGPVDIITNGISTITNNTGTPFMTKGGTGDILAGILGAILARGVDYMQAAQAAAYINGRAGELASFEMGEGLAASDMFEFIPKVINTDESDIQTSAA